MKNKAESLLKTVASGKGCKILCCSIRVTSYARYSISVSVRFSFQDLDPAGFWTMTLLPGHVFCKWTVYIFFCNCLTHQHCHFWNCQNNRCQEKTALLILKHLLHWPLFPLCQGRIVAHRGTSWHTRWNSACGYLLFIIILQFCKSNTKVETWHNAITSIRLIIFFLWSTS